MGIKNWPYRKVRFVMTMHYNSFSFDPICSCVSWTSRFLLYFRNHRAFTQLAQSSAIYEDNVSCLYRVLITTLAPLELSHLIF